MNRPELKQQKKVAEFLRIQKEYGHVLAYTATAQSTFTNYKQININAALGVQKGLPDLIILLPPKDGGICTRLVFIEMKHPDVSLSAVSKEQKEWIRGLNQVGPTVFAFVCFSAEQAISALTELIVDISCPSSEHPVADFESFLNESQ